MSLGLIAECSSLSSDSHHVENEAGDEQNESNVGVGIGVDVMVPDCAVSKVEVTSVSPIGENDDDLNLNLDRVKSTGSKLPCGICGKTVARGYLSKHKKRVHTQTQGRYKCPQCPSFFINFNRLSVHLIRDHAQAPGQKGFSCPMQRCGKRVDRWASLESHMTSAHGQTLKWSPELEDSCRVTSSGRLVPESSVPGGGSGSGPSTLKKRFRSHACTICKEQFGDSSRLREHMTRHKRRRSAPWKCTRCHSFFTKRYALVGHENRVHGLKYMGRERGNIKTKRIAGYVKQGLTHADSKPFCCLYCGGEFNCRTSAWNHVKSNHANHGEERVQLRPTRILMTRSDDYDSLPKNWDSAGMGPAEMGEVAGASTDLRSGNNICQAVPSDSDQANSTTEGTEQDHWKTVASEETQTVSKSTTEPKHEPSRANKSMGVKYPSSDFRCTRDRDFSRHMRVHSFQGKEFKCVHCTYSFATFQGLLIHNGKLHKGSNPGDPTAGQGRTPTPSTATVEEVQERGEGISSSPSKVALEKVKEVDSASASVGNVQNEEWKTTSQSKPISSTLALESTASSAPHAQVPLLVQETAEDSISSHPDSGSSPSDASQTSCLKPILAELPPPHLPSSPSASDQIYLSPVPVAMDIGADKLMDIENYRVQQAPVELAENGRQTNLEPQSEVINDEEDDTDMDICILKCVSLAPESESGYMEGVKINGGKDNDKTLPSSPPELAGAGPENMHITEDIAINDDVEGSDSESDIEIIAEKPPSQKPTKPAERRAAILDLLLNRKVQGKR